MSNPEFEQVEETECLCIMPDLEVGSFDAYSMDLLSLRISGAQVLYLLVEHLKSLSTSYFLSNCPPIIFMIIHLLEKKL